VANDGSIFDDGQNMMEEVHDSESAKVFLASDNAVERIEERVQCWIKRLKDFMLESKQVRRESDSSGPQQELEYWKRRGAQFSQLVARLRVTYTTIFKFHS
jgi:dynein heavy chain